MLTVKAKVVDGVTRLTYFRAGTKVGSARLLGTTMGDLEVLPKFRRLGIGREILLDMISRGGRFAIAGSSEGEALMRRMGGVETSPKMFTF